MTVRHRWHLGVVAGLVCLATAWVTGPGHPRVAGAASCATPTADHVAVVIDFGTAGATAECVVLSASVRNGMQALRAATDNRIGQDASGKVCQIDGIPATYDARNCSAPQDGMIAYWAYFHGTAGGWAYSSVGAAGWRVRPDVVEGWHFVRVPAANLNSAPPPRNFPNGASYAWETVCPAVRVTPPPSQTPPPPPAPTAGGAPGRSGPGAAPSGGRAASAGGLAASAGAPSPGAGPTSTTRRGAAGPSPTTTVRSHGSTTTGSGTATTAPPATGLRSTVTVRRLTRAQVDAAARAARPSSRPVGAIVAGVVGVAVIAVGLVVVTLRSRRRRLVDDSVG